MYNEEFTQKNTINKTHFNKTISGLKHVYVLQKHQSSFTEIIGM